jgi:hypothetical protein
MLFGKHVSADLAHFKIQVLDPLPAVFHIKNQNPNRMKKNAFL